MLDKSFFSISDLASEFNVTTRTIRFYEEKKLIKPKRSKGNQRRYSKRDRTRLRLILRGKKFGIKLDEISKILGLAEFETEEKNQLKRAIEVGSKYLENIQLQMKEFKKLEEELIFYGDKCKERLKELGD